MLPPDFQRKEVSAPPLYLDPDKRTRFDQLWATSLADPSRPIPYTCTYPKYEFLIVSGRCPSGSAPRLE